ncbi:Dnaj homolog subfamily b member 9 [Phtheirospermum japonicum]|uniref:Dnaj homolog subfamily b member 9 n=1 Tax=Phtheirospermum japonicum TaxID=374723 RepID=A0A830D542_9LAMI|nr:Dnaj homolog subfamily b member 9 [Phtheirospermum japonicum]
METSRAEAERLLGIAEKLLRNKDYGGCRDFAILAQETEPLLEGSDQILAVAEVLLASENKRHNNQPEWYSVLQIPQRTDEAELIKKQYRRLALLLHPDKNKFPFSDSAFRLVADSWAALSDPAKKSAYDNEFVSRFTKVDLAAMKKQQQQQFNQQKKQQARGDSNSHQKLPVRRSARGSASGDTPAAGAGVKASKRSISENPNFVGNIWTACPYCYNLYEYPKVYEGCCLRCDNENCKRAYTATPILSMPPMVPGSEAYYCCWGFFPMGFASGNAGKGNGFPKWMPPMFGESEEAAPVVEESPAPPAPPPPPPPVPETVTPVTAAAAPAPAATSVRKRGRPKKNV